MELSNTLRNFGFIPCNEEVYLFVHQVEPLFIFVYVDDFLLIAPQSLYHHLQQVKERLISKYAFRDLGNAKQFLNIRIIRDPAARKL